MKTIDSYKISARLVEDVKDTRALAMAVASNRMNPDDGATVNTAYIKAEKDLPVTYIARVQIRLLFIMWLTIWRKNCDMSDGDTRAAIKREARDLIKTIEL